MNEKILRSNTKTVHFDIPTAIEKVRANLTPDLLQFAYRAQNAKIHPMYGHCYVATEALWHLTGQRLEVWRGRDPHGVVHWWLQDAVGNRYDPTSDQYTGIGEQPPYLNGRRGCFLTGSVPSKRAQTLLSRILLA